MTLSKRLKYHVSVDLLGASALRLERMRMALKMRLPGAWSHPYINPPLRCSARLKELITRHYLRGRTANDAGPVAWVTSGAPVELLVALGYYVLYPENHGAVCGIRRDAEDLCTVAEEAGYSRDLCSYARTDIGTVLSGKTPVGRLPRPDVLFCCNNICQTVLLWYQVLARHFDVPLIVIDTPFIYDAANDHAVDYVERQLDTAIEVAERVARRSLTSANLERAARHGADASALWAKVMACASAHPAPLTAFDQFIHMGPIVEMRGEPYTVDYYRTMLAELEERNRRGVGALRLERHRLLWDNLPIWHRLRWLSNLLARHGVAVVASTYTNAWGELASMMDPSDPLRSAARVYMHPILNRGTGAKLETMRQMVDDFDIDGVILHSDRSCKPYSIGQIDQLERLLRDIGVPALLLEADHNDPRAFSEQQVENRLTAFVETVQGL